METLLLLRQTLESHIPQTLQPFLSRLLPLIASCVNEDWFKIIAESLRTLGAVILVARPQLNDNNNNSNSNSNNNIAEIVNNGNEEYDFRPLVLPIYNSVLTRLEALDIDQEIKDCSIATVGRLFAYFGDELKQQLPIVLNLLKKKLENENTRTQTLKSISILANSKLNLDLSSVLLDSTNELSLFLRQKSRSLKQITLFTLDSLVNSKSVILSDIEQSGQSTKTLYKEIAKLLKQYKINELIGIGKNISANASAFTIKKTFFENTNEFVNAFNSKNLQFNNSTILLKGARSFGFENISQLLQQKSHDTVLEINLNKLTENINYYRSLMKPETQIMCMVKATGYGSGSAEIAKTLQHIGVNYLAVAYADEGVELRNAQINLPVMVMSPEEDSFEDIINYNLEPEIYSFRVLELFCKALQKSGYAESFPVHIKLDTGMHRLGFEVDRFYKLNVHMMIM